MKMSTKDTHTFMYVNTMGGIAKRCVVLRGDVLVILLLHNRELATYDAKSNRPITYIIAPMTPDIHADLYKRYPTMIYNTLLH